MDDQSPPRKSGDAQRGLIETINASEGIVYVEKGQCQRGARACLVSVTSGGGHRFLRVHVNTGEADWDLMGSIGHELRHTIEVGGFLKPFETDAAVETGAAVRAEVQKYRRR